MDNIIFADELTEADMQAVMEQPDLCKEALLLYDQKLTY